LGNPSSEDLILTLGGNATVLLEFGEVRVLTDPWLTETIGPWRRWKPFAIPAEKLKSLTAILISHAHPDHLSPGSLTQLAPETPILMPSGIPERRLEALNRRTHALHEWESWESDALRIICAPSIHCRDCLSFVIEVGGRKVYFGGDCGPKTPFDEIRTRLGPFDGAILPVGGSSLAVGPLQRHLTPALAVAATQALAPRWVVPMHWGHVPCVPAALDCWRGTAEAFREAGACLVGETTVLCLEEGMPTLISA
jgi:L-ascorbate metabolism protein UlaG (beta-lactamase superfamily)